MVLSSSRSGPGAGLGSAVVVLMIWLPDGLLSLPERLRDRRQSRLASAARARHAMPRGDQA